MPPPPPDPDPAAASEAPQPTSPQPLSSAASSPAADSQLLTVVRRCQARARERAATADELELLKALVFRDEKGEQFDHLKHERVEQLVALRQIQPHHRVLELGARYGTVSCAIQLRRPERHVAVEPDSRTWEALAGNIAANKCESCELWRGFVSRQPLQMAGLEYGYGAHSVAATDAASATSVPHCSLEELERLPDGTTKPFTVLIADCEGFLEVFFDENPKLIESDLELVIFEADRPDLCDYAKIRAALRQNGFACEVAGHQNVWRRERRQ